MFLKTSSLSQRLCQNIKRSRTQVSREDINGYLNNLEHSLNNIPPSNILNYDETNLSDDPGRIKYPLKIDWRTILTTWKIGAGKNELAIPKLEFPRLLNVLMNDIKKIKSIISNQDL